MHRLYIILLLWSSFVASVVASEHFIVLGYGESEKLLETKAKYEKLLKSEGESSISFSIDSMGTTSVLHVGPFKRDNTLALHYMKLKALVPHAVIVEKEERSALVETKPAVSTVEKKVYVTKEVPVEKEDTTLLIALFGLAFISVIFMFLSSYQIKRLKAEHEKIKNKHKKLEKKQHEVLSSMGESIHTLARETMGHTSAMVEKVKETALEEDMQKVMYNENELLDVTGDLIRFLRLKSKKVTIQNEVFNFNHVLNEVAGMLNNTYKKSDIEVVYNISKEVPRYMFSDSLHLGQILTNLLDHSMHHSQNKEVLLEVVSNSGLKEGLVLEFTIDTALTIEDKETFFDAYYDEQTRNYVGLGLFVAYELTQLMNGTLTIVGKDNGYSDLVLSIPMEEKNKEKRKYRLPDKGLVGKKILIVDSNLRAAEATDKLFSYFRAEVKCYSVEEFHESIPNLARYDIVILENKLFNTKTLNILKKVKQSEDLKVMSLDNLFSSHECIKDDAIDIRLVKPLTQEYVFDTLIELYETKEEKKPLEEDENGADKLLVHRHSFKDVNNVSLDSFERFEGAKVLVVEDNVINQKVLLSVLGKSKMVLHVVNNGQEAVEFMQDTTEEIDFVFMDINMPVLDGYRATQAIREDSRFDNVPIVALTALVSEHEIDKMFASGMNGYLSKPVRIDRVYNALEVFLHGDDEAEVSEQPTDTKYEGRLEGLNVEEGLAHVKDNNVFYKEVLREFMDAYASSDTIFERLVKERRHTQIGMLCLDMKGLTGTIGAKEMHTMISEIHQQLLYNKPEFLESYIEQYKTELTKLKKSIEIYLSA